MSFLNIILVLYMFLQDIYNIGTSHFFSICQTKKSQFNTSSKFFTPASVDEVEAIEESEKQTVVIPVYLIMLYDNISVYSFKS